MALASHTTPRHLKKNSLGMPSICKAASASRIHPAPFWQVATAREKKKRQLRDRDTCRVAFYLQSGHVIKAQPASRFGEEKIDFTDAAIRHLQVIIT